MDSVLKQARQVLTHPNFSKLTPQQMQEVYRSLLASGVTKDDIRNILLSKPNLTYLESLPYNIFLNLVTNGEIKGKDLIRFCNSSPLINDKCNRPFQLAKSGDFIPEYLFYLLLKQDGIENKTNPRIVYIFLQTETGKTFHTLYEKIKAITDVNARLVYPMRDEFGYSLGEFPQDLDQLLYHHLKLLYGSIYYLEENLIHSYINVCYIVKHYPNYTGQDSRVLLFLLYLKGGYDGILKFNNKPLQMSDFKRDYYDKYDELIVTSLLRNMVIVKNDSMYVENYPLMIQKLNLIRISIVGGAVAGLEVDTKLSDEEKTQLSKKISGMKFTSQESNLLFMLHFLILQNKIKATTPFTYEALLPILSEIKITK